MQIDLCEPSSVLVRVHLDLLGRDSRRYTTVANGVEQFFELVRIHHPLRSLGLKLPYSPDRRTYQLFNRLVAAFNEHS